MRQRLSILLTLALLVTLTSDAEGQGKPPRDPGSSPNPNPPGTAPRDPGGPNPKPPGTAPNDPGGPNPGGPRDPNNLPRDPRVPGRLIDPGSIRFQNIGDYLTLKQRPEIEDPPLSSREAVMQQMLNLINEKLQSQVNEALKDSVQVDDDALKKPAGPQSDDDKAKGLAALRNLKKLKGIGQPGTPPALSQKSTETPKPDDALDDLVVPQLVQMKSLLSEATDRERGYRVQQGRITQVRIVQPNTLQPDSAGLPFNPETFRLTKSNPWSDDGHTIDKPFLMPVEDVFTIAGAGGGNSSHSGIGYRDGKLKLDFGAGAALGGSASDVAMETLTLSHEGFQTAGSSAGSWSLPEVGDEVLVGFEHGDSRGHSSSQFNPHEFGMSKINSWQPSADRPRYFNGRFLTARNMQRESTNASQPYLQYRLPRAYVKSWSTAGGPADRPTEEVAFYYNKIAFKYKSTTDGKPARHSLARSTYGYNDQSLQAIPRTPSAPVSGFPVVGDWDGDIPSGAQATGSASDKRKQSLYFPEHMLQEIQNSAAHRSGSIVAGDFHYTERARREFDPQPLYFNVHTAAAGDNTNKYLSDLSRPNSGQPWSDWVNEHVYAGNTGAAQLPPGDVLLDRWQRNGVGHVAKIDAFALKQKVVENNPDDRFNGKYLVTGATHQYDKVVVRGWNPEKKEMIVGEAEQDSVLGGSRGLYLNVHTPASGNGKRVSNWHLTSAQPMKQPVSPRFTKFLNDGTPLRNTPRTFGGAFVFATDPLQTSVSNVRTELLNNKYPENMQQGSNSGSLITPSFHREWVTGSSQHDTATTGQKRPPMTQFVWGSAKFSPHSIPSLATIHAQYDMSTTVEHGHSNATEDRIFDWQKAQQLSMAPDSAPRNGRLLLVSRGQFNEADAGIGNTFTRGMWSDGILEHTDVQKVTDRPAVQMSQKLFVGGLSWDTDTDISPIDQQGRYKVVMPFDVEPTSQNHKYVFQRNESNLSFHRQHNNARIKVKFPWLAPDDSNASAGYGMHLPLHAGTEAVIAHVSENQQMPPYSLPGSKQISGIRSNSTAGGGRQNDRRFWKSRSGHMLLFNDADRSDAAAGQYRESDWNFIQRWAEGSSSNSGISHRSTADDRSSTWLRAGQQALGGSRIVPSQTKVILLAASANPDPATMNASRNGNLHILDLSVAAATPSTAAYNSFEAWPAKWKGFTLDGSSRQHASSSGVTEELYGNYNFLLELSGVDSPFRPGSFDVKLEGKNATRSGPLLGHELSHAVQQLGGMGPRSSSTDDRASTWVRVSQLNAAGGAIVPDQKTIVGGFKSVSGMDSETEIVELATGGYLSRLRIGRDAEQGNDSPAEPFGTVDGFRIPESVEVETASSVIKNRPDTVKNSTRNMNGPVPIPYPNFAQTRSSSTAGDPDRPIIAGAVPNAETARYNFYHAWPAKWYVPDNAASDSNGHPSRWIRMAQPSAGGGFDRPLVTGRLFNGAPHGDAHGQKVHASPFESIQASFGTSLSAQGSLSTDSAIRGYDLSHRLNRGTR